MGRKVLYLCQKEKQTLLKGNEALENFFSSPRQGNMERKSKLKK